MKCRFQAPLEGWAELGTVERFTLEEQKRRSAALMHSWGIGPKLVPKKKSLYQYIRYFFLGEAEPVDPSEQYQLIQIADELDPKSNKRNS
jgi:hypothetical protein